MRDISCFFDFHLACGADKWGFVIGLPSVYCLMCRGVYCFFFEFFVAWCVLVIKWSFCVVCNAFVDVLALLCGEGRDGFGLVLVV